MGEERKSFYKKWWFWGIVLIIVILCITMYLFKPKSVGVGSAGISLEEFEAIETEMIMTEVCEIINKENVNNVKSQQLERIEDTTGTLYKYRYEGEKKGYTIITYELSTTDLWAGKGAKVITKEKFDLK